MTRKSIEHQRQATGHRTAASDPFQGWEAHGWEQDGNDYWRTGLGEGWVGTVEARQDGFHWKLVHEGETEESGVSDTLDEAFVAPAIALGRILMEADRLRRRRASKTASGPAKQGHAHRRANAHKEGTNTMNRKDLLTRIAEQQVIIDGQGEALNAIAEAAGLDLTAIKSKTSRRIASIRRRADAENPAQPVPEPGTEAPAVTTEEAKTPEATEDVTSAGGAVATEDVLADAKTDVTTPGTVLDEPLDLNEQDPTKQVAGTEEPQDAKVDVNVTNSDPTAGPAAFPVDLPTAPKVSSQDRVFASIRLSRLRIQAGIVPEQDEVILGQSLANDKSLSDHDIANEIATLSKVVENQKAATAKPVARNLVPRMASGGTRQMPSMAPSAPASPEVPGMSPSSDEVDTLW